MGPRGERGTALHACMSWRDFSSMCTVYLACMHTARRRRMLLIAMHTCTCMHASYDPASTHAHKSFCAGAQASGRMQRKLAHAIQLPDFGDEQLDAAVGGGTGTEQASRDASADATPSSAAAAAAARSAMHRGHRLPATAVVRAVPLGGHETLQLPSELPRPQCSRTQDGHMSERRGENKWEG